MLYLNVEIKAISVLICFFCGCCLYAQIDNNKIVELRQTASRLENEIKLKTDSLDLINASIKQIQHEEFLSNINELSKVAVVKSNGKLRKSNNPTSEVIVNLYSGDSIILTDYQNGYWIINKDQYFGYLSELYIDVTPEIVTFKEILGKINEELLKKKKEEDYKEYEKQSELDKQKALDYKNTIYSKFGNETGQKILDRKYWLGMTDEMALISLGKPNRVNRSVGSWGVHEQWVYDNKYLYFENGKLSSYQN